MKTINRQEEIIKLRNIGWSWAAIGNTFNISRARAHQIGSGYNSSSLYRDEILKRDNYTCQWQEKCSGNCDDLIVHHIDFNDRNNNYKNLITLCSKCHQYFHVKEGLNKFGHRPTTKLINCLTCNTKIIINGKKWCSKECKDKYLYEKRKRICVICGKEYKIRQFIRPTRFCSRICLGKYAGAHFGFQKGHNGYK